MATQFINQIRAKGLKVTPQRIAILETICVLNNHPTADQIINYIKIQFPTIAVGTVYKILESFVEHEIIQKVKCEDDIMRYDACLNKHHHLYAKKTDRIEDFEDAELDQLLANYFKKKEIENFLIHDIKLQITGEFLK